MIDSKTTEILRSAPNSILAKWWCMLNSWQWPREIPEPEQPILGIGSKNPRRHALMNTIDKIVGHKVINREWNRERMTDAEHEEWWRRQILGPAADKKDLPRGGFF
jgi:hypothetical protein